MDTRTVVMSSASVWDLLAQLASLARQRIPVPERQVVLNQIGCLVRDALGSAWGVLSVGDENATLTSFWGIDADRAAELLGDPGTLGQEGAALSFEPGPAEQGQLMFEAGDELRELLEHGFGLALREQLGLVLAHTAAPAANDAATNGAAVLHTPRTHAGANALDERIDEALSVVLHQGAQTLVADWAAFLLVDTATSNWHVAACTTTCPQDALHAAVLREALTALAGVPVPRLLANADAHMQPLLEACRSAMLLASAVQPDTSTPGLLLVGYDQSIPMSTEDALILTGVLARQLASAFTNAHFNTDEHRRSGIFAALQALSQRTGTARSANEVFHTLVEGAHALMSFRASEIRAFDPVLQQLSAVLTTGIRHRTLPHYNRLSEGLAGYVARNRRSLRLGNLSDAPVKPLFQTLHSGNGSTRIQSYVGVPIVLGGQLFGTFELFSDRPNHFTVTDERLLIMLTNQAAQTLAGLQRSEETDAHLHRRIQQLRALQRISRELTATLYLHNILAFALDEACRATGASHGYIALRGYQTVQEVYDLEQEEALGVTPSPQVYISLRETSHEQAFHIITTSGYSSDEQAQLVNQALTRSVAEQTASRGETTLVDQLASDDRPRGVGSAVASVVAVPIYYEAQVIGVINLHGSLAHTFDRDALEFARAVADLAALAIGNEQRWTEQRRQRDLLQQRASTLNEVLRIGQELRADRSLTDVLEQVAFSVAEAASYRAVAFFVYLGNNDSMQFVAAAGLPLTEVERLKRVGIPEAVREQIFAREHRVGRCYFVTGDRMRELAPYLDLTEGDQAGDPNDQSWQPNDAVYVPLYSTQGHLLGLLAADEPYDRQRPTRRSVESLEIFADQAAIAIENAALLRDAREQTERMTGLYRMSASMAATFDLDELLERGYNEIVNYLGTPSFVYVAAFDIHSQQMRFELFKREGVDHERLRKATFPKGGWTGWVIDRDDVVHLRDILVDGESIPIQSIALGEEIRSWVGIPLRSQDTVIGVLSVQSFEPNAFSDQDVQFLLTLGNHMAVALEKARLFGEREARIAELNMINRVGEITSSTLSIEQMLNALYECLTGYLPIDSFFAHIYQDERDDITIAFTVDEQVRQFEMNNGSPRAGSLSHWILTNRQPLRFTNLPEQIEAYGITPRSFGNTSRRSASWLGVPLLLGESKIMGVIGVQSYTPNLYSDREQAFLMTVARQVALGIQNALLYNQAQAQVRQLALINQVSATAAETLEVDTVLQATVTALLQATEADQARLALYDREQGIVTVQAEAMLSGMQYESTARLNEQPLVAWLDQNRRPYLAQDAQRDPMIATWHDSLSARDVRSVLAIPLVAEQVIGVVWLDYVGRQSDAGQRELELALTIANQTAVALEKARLFHMTQQSADALQHKVGELSALLESARVLSSSLQPQEVLNSLMAVVQRHLRVDTVALWQNDGEDMLLPAAMLGIPTDIAQTLRVPVGQGLTGRVAAASTPMIVDNVEQDGGSLYPDFNRQNQYTSFLGVPVRYRERTIGVLSVMTVQQRTFTQDDVQLLTGMADQAAVALENARLFEEREKRLRELIALKDISSEITSTLDMQDVLERLHFQISQVIDVRTSAMVLYDRDQDRMVYAVAYDQGQRIDVPPQPVIGPAGWVIRNRKPLLLHTHEELIQLNGSGLHFGDTNDEEQSFVVVPIISGDMVLGVIDIQSYEPHAFDDDDLRFLGTVASQASISMTNASLFYERGRRIEELATFNRLGQEISAIVSQDELLDVLYRQTSRLLDVKNFHVALYDERRNTVTLPLVVENDEVVTIGDVLTLENTLTGYVLRTRSPLLINSDLENELERRGIRALKHIGPNTTPRSWLGVPMITADKVIGAIGVQSFDRELAFSQDDVRLLQTIAAWSATALENARLLGETRQSVQDLTALYDVSVLLAGQLNAADILTSTASSVLELLSADVSVVFLTGTDDNMPPVMIDLSGESDQPALLAAFEPLNDRMLSATAPTEIEPVPAEIQRSAGLRSLLGVPIVANDRHIGVVWVGNRTVRNWDGRAVSLSSIFSNQLSQTLARAELFRSEQARRRVADTLRETAQIFTTLRPFNDILELIFDQLGHVLPYDSASVMLREDNELHIVGGRGFTPETQTVIKNLRFTVNEDPHLEQVMTTRQPLVLDDAQASPYFVPAAGTEHIRGWIAAPILADDEVVGLVTVDSHEIGAYDADDAQLVFALASQAAQAIRNAYQYEQITSLNADLERRVAERTAELEDEQDRLRAVHAITLELTATLELELTLNKALELAARAVGAQRGSIMLREADGDALTCRAVLNPDGEVVTTSIPISFADGGGLSGWIINARSAVCIADVRTDTRWLREEGRADEVRSVIAAPLMTQDGPLGVLMLSSPHEAFFGDAQLQLLTTIGNEIAIVIHNAALYKVISELAYDRGISEAQQREENSKNQAILQSLGEGVMVFDEQQQVVLFNPAAEQMLGIPASALAGQSLKNVRTQATAGGDTTRAEHVYTGLNDGLRLLDEQGRNHNRMLELSAPSQTIALNFAPWVGPRGAVYGSVVVMRDVTREIESDRAKREFISSVSHELRTPLTSIKGYVDLLMLGSAGQLSENQTAFLSVVKNNANRLMDLINDILEIGRIDSDKIVLNFDEVDIANMFADVLQTLRVQIDRKSMRVRAEVAERLPVITADSKRITQVVLNLVSNAIKYTYAEGQILLRADLNPAGMVQIDVKDNGVGISQEDQKNLFRRFQRFDNPLRDEAGGTGLGLSIAKSLVELHGGEMWVESEPGDGSTFSFVIPVSQPDPNHEIDSE